MDYQYSEIMRITTELGELAARVVPGPPEVAILWHSMFTDSRSWDPILDDLRAKRTLVLVDGWSFGASGNLDRVVPKFIDRCVQGAVAVVAQVQKELAAGPVDWLGSAWGGHVGMHLAATRPELVRSLITVSTPVQAASPLHVATGENAAPCIPGHRNARADTAGAARRHADGSDTAQ